MALGVTVLKLLLMCIQTPDGVIMAIGTRQTGGTEAAGVLVTGVMVMVGEVIMVQAGAILITGPAGVTHIMHTILITTHTTEAIPIMWLITEEDVIPI